MTDDLRKPTFDVDDRHPDDRKVNPEQIVDLTVTTAGQLPVLTPENALDAPQEFIAKSLRLYLRGTAIRELALETGIPEEVFAIWAREYKWDDKRNDSIRDLLMSAELKYREFTYKHRVSTAERNLDTAAEITTNMREVTGALKVVQGQLLAEIQSAAPNPKVIKSLDSSVKILARLASTYKQLSEAGRNSAEISSRAVDSLQDASPQLPDLKSGMFQQNQPLVVINNDSRTLVPHGPMLPESFAPGQGRAFEYHEPKRIEKGDIEHV